MGIKNKLYLRGAQEVVILSSEEFLQTVGRGGWINSHRMYGPDRDIFLLSQQNCLMIRTDYDITAFFTISSGYFLHNRVLQIEIYAN